MSAISQDGTPMSTYARLLAVAEGGGVAAGLELLDHMRLHHIREPTVVLAHGQRVLRAGGPYSLGNRRWDISEQVAVAALDVGADDVAETGLSLIRDNAVPGTTGLPSLSKLQADGFSVLLF